MKTSKYLDSLIMSLLKQAEAGTPVPNLCREHGMRTANYYKWKSKYSGKDLSFMTPLKELKAENSCLKRWINGVNSMRSGMYLPNPAIHNRMHTLSVLIEQYVINV